MMELESSMENVQSLMGIKTEAGRGKKARRGNLSRLDIIGTTEETWLTDVNVPRWSLA